MIIGLALYGIFHGYHTNAGSAADFRHCFPNTRRMIIDPLREQGHVVKTFVCTYPILDPEALRDFHAMVDPVKVEWCDFTGSSQYTTKTGLFKTFAEEKDLDVVIFARCDIHYANPINRLSFDMEKFNFLFREKNHWHNLKYATDNIYMWPHRTTPVIRKAMIETISTARSQGRRDTHNLYNVLSHHLSGDDIHFVSEVHALSDVNIFYSLCRSHLPDRPCLHPEVRERFVDQLIKTTR